MKTLKKLLVITVAVILASIKPVLADTIGYADFKKIESNYSYAQKVYKDLDDKVLELQQYLINKDKEYKAIESPLSKKNFEEKTEKEYKAKEDAVLKLKLQKEEEDLMRLSCHCDLKICYLCKASIIRTNGRCPFCGVKVFQSADFASLK